MALTTSWSPASNAASYISAIGTRGRSNKPERANRSRRQGEADRAVASQRSSSQCADDNERRITMHSINLVHAAPINTGAQQMRNRGRVYHTHWMSKHYVPPLPLWVVGWFVVPLEEIILCIKR